MNLEVKRVWTDDNCVYAESAEGKVASYAFADWPRLANATKAQREDFYLSPCGIHWPQIDEDLSFSGMFDQTSEPVSYKLETLLDAYESFFIFVLVHPISAVPRP